MLRGVACLGWLLGSCASDPGTARVEVDLRAGRVESSLEERVLAGVNEYRRSVGKPALERHEGLDRMARDHSRFMLANRGRFRVHGRNVSHDGFEGRVLVAQHKYDMETISENVIAGERLGGDVAGKLVRCWVGSPDHVDNLSGDWSATGIGVVVDGEGGVFATQLFGMRRLGSRWSGGLQPF